MAVSSVQYDVGAVSPVQIASGIKRCLIQNLGGYHVYLGGSGVTEADGLRLAPSEPIVLPVTLATLESIYAIAAGAAGSATSDIRVLSYLGI